MLHFNERKPNGYFAQLTGTGVVYQYYITGSKLVIKTSEGELIFDRELKSLAVCVLLSNCHAMVFDRIEEREWHAVTFTSRSYDISFDGNYFSMSCTGSEIAYECREMTLAACEDYARIQELVYCHRDFEGYSLLLALDDDRLMFWTGEKIATFNLGLSIHHDLFIPDASSDEIQAAIEWGKANDFPALPMLLKPGPEKPVLCSSLAKIPVESMQEILVDFASASAIIGDNGFKPFAVWWPNYQKELAQLVFSLLEPAEQINLFDPCESDRWDNKISINILNFNDRAYLVELFVSKYADDIDAKILEVQKL